MKILITGGFGYLGGRVAQSLIEQGHQVKLASRKEQTVPDWLPQAEVVKIDWTDQISLQFICKDIDTVIHTAGMNAQDCSIDPVGAIEFNGVATARLVQASIAEGVTKFIYLSTAHVYSSPLVGEIDEKSCPTNIHPYATSHIVGENAVLYQSNRIDNFMGIILRLSNGIGAPTHKHTNCWMLAVNDFCRQVVESGKIIVNSSSEVERDFVQISLLCKSIHSIIDGFEVDSGIINISSSNAVSLEEITNVIKDRSELVLGFVPEVIFKSERSVNSNRKLLLSNQKLKKIIEVEINLIDEIDQLLLRCKTWFD